MKTAKSMFEKLKNIYKEGKEFADQVSFLLHIIKVSGNASKEDIVKTIEELKDVYRSARGIGTLLSEITWSGNGRNALTAFLKYKILNKVPKIVRWIAVKYVADQIIKILRGIMPNPNKQKDK